MYIRCYFTGIVERAKEKAAEKGTNMTAIENECGLGHGVIGRWNSNSPSIDKVEIIANFLSVSIENLITGKEPGNLIFEEQQRVNLYRQADDRGKRSIFRTAQDEARDSNHQFLGLDQPAPIVSCATNHL